MSRHRTAAPRSRHRTPPRIIRNRIIAGALVLGLVTLIVSTEQALKERHGVSVTIVDERALSMEKSPFRTVATLADYVWTLVKEKQGHAG